LFRLWSRPDRATQVFDLTASDFTLTDNGIPQHVALDADSDAQPPALAICVQTGGAGARHLATGRGGWVQ
jgi:hypothetical protein